MDGRRVSHYEVHERLGGGGMGEVYRAVDTRLGRSVALKFLPPEMTRDDVARTRFVQEARAASALDHPNICTIYEIDTTDDGQMFIAMAFYSGETLKERIQRGDISVAEAVRIGAQIARGLTKAHQAGIIHRDIKPANLMVTDDGLVKILDFGIAKLLGVTGPTRTGDTLGTVSYMSPEQVDGDNADPRSDVWALGVVLYEMLAGSVPFKGESQWAVMNSILNNDAAPVGSLNVEVSPELERVVGSALVKDPEQRMPSADAFRSRLEASLGDRGGEGASGGSLGATSAPWRRAIAAAAVVLVLALIGWSVVAQQGRAAARQADQEALQQVLDLIDDGDFSAAFALGENLESRLPDDPILADAMQQASVTTTIETEPSGADVYIRPYSGSDADWELLGRSPVEDVRLPRRSVAQVRVEADGYEPRTVASGVPGFYLGYTLTTPPSAIRLQPLGSVPGDMVYVPGGTFNMRLSGLTRDSVSLEPFLLDRYEVTNAQYAEFVEAGGYERQTFWEGLDFVKDGRRLSWSEAMDEMVDGTGRTGPATWEYGAYPSGQEDYPVTGVSWYESVAYLRFRQRDLPTVYHWARAAIEPQSIAQSFPVAMLPLANFLSDGPTAVSESRAMGPNGTYDMAGNVKEWILNASGNGPGDNRWLMGGAWPDDDYMYTVRFSAPPFDRSAVNGIRGASYIGGELPDSLTAPALSHSRQIAEVEPVSDERFAEYRDEMRYVPAPELDVRLVSEGDSTHPDWIHDVISLPAETPGQRFQVHVFVPESAERPYQALVFMPGIGGFQAPGRLNAARTLVSNGFGMGDLVRSGRMLVWPVWAGSYDRWDGFLYRPREQRIRAIGARVQEWASELGKTIDYLETRPDIDVDRIGYYGVSFGGSTPLPLLALEERLKAALIYAGGYPNYQAPPAADVANYAPRITIPVLMIGGAADFTFPIETAQRPLLERLGTPDDQKSLIIYDLTHSPPPPGPFRRDAVPWLDRYLGVPARR